MEKEITLFVGSSIIKKWNTSLYFPNSINLGIAGLTTQGLITQGLITQVNKSITNIVVYIGSNDIKKTNPTQIITNTTEFILLLENNFPHIKQIIYVAILKSPSRTEIQKKKIDYVNRKMREFSQKTENNRIIFCNVNRELSSMYNYLADKTHLSEIGYSILSNKIKSLISKYPTHF